MVDLAYLPPLRTHFLVKEDHPLNAVVVNVEGAFRKGITLLTYRAQPRAD